MLPCKCDKKRNQSCCSELKEPNLDVRNAAKPRPGDHESHVLRGIQPLHDSNVPQPTIILHRSLELYTCESNFHRVDTTGTIIQSNKPSFDRKPKKGGKHNSSLFEIIQQGAGSLARHLWGTKSRSINSRKHLSEGVQRACQRSYYRVLSNEPEDVPSDIEE
ncbi:hypothetical protein FXO38_04975 [Capsicum annuum]|nr:hypothetical protein FXO38_04975 [Capsicum annuum]KAF3683981.1 hypothetical protein FXO37_01574 [Capsicum annuum]